MSGNTPDTLLVYCTCPDEAAGAELATHLVEQGLAGCINVLPGITSIYKWHGTMKSGTEALLLIKTPANKYPALEQAIRSRHPYELPEIIAVSIETGLPDYLNWIAQETDIRETDI
ncbi:MAG: divalent-cation tolerance protein CutA [Gammaproteobacteria bacterium]|nr:divalent-cation tolerance protein CutA [Gammaproteobacteria bacterium]NND55448.1 divalent-cation tolerance protein CutA [Gammaproteobacteria bacterium]